MFESIGNFMRDAGRGVAALAGIVLLATVLYLLG